MKSFFQSFSLRKHIARLRHSSGGGPGSGGLAFGDILALTYSPGQSEASCFSCVKYIYFPAAHLPHVLFPLCLLPRPKVPLVEKTVKSVLGSVLPRLVSVQAAAARGGWPGAVMGLFAQLQPHRGHLPGPATKAKALWASAFLRNVLM